MDNHLTCVHKLKGDQLKKILKLANVVETYKRPCTDPITGNNDNVVNVSYMEVADAVNQNVVSESGLEELNERSVYLVAYSKMAHLYMLLCSTVY